MADDLKTPAHKSATELPPADAQQPPEHPIETVKKALISKGTERMLEFATLFGGELLVSVAAHFAGWRVANELKQHLQSMRGQTSQGQPSPAPAATPQPPAATNEAKEPPDPTLHSILPGNWTKMNEAETGMVLGSNLRRAHTRIEQAREGSAPAEIAREEQALERLIKLLTFLADQLTQTEIDNLRYTVGNLKTAEQQSEFYDSLALLADNGEQVRNFLVVQGLIREPSPLLVGIANGVSQSPQVRDRILDEKRRRREARHTARTHRP